MLNFSILSKFQYLHLWFVCGCHRLCVFIIVLGKSRNCETRKDDKNNNNKTSQVLPPLATVNTGVYFEVHFGAVAVTHKLCCCLDVHIPYLGASCSIHPTQLFLRHPGRLWMVAQVLIPSPPRRPKWSSLICSSSKKMVIIFLKKNYNQLFFFVEKETGRSLFCSSTPKVPTFGAGPGTNKEPEFCLGSRCLNYHLLPPRDVHYQEAALEVESEVEPRHPDMRFRCPK